MKIVTLTSDFGVQSQGVGIMEAMIASISPHIKVIHLMHGLPSFDILAAARTLETVRYVPLGYHVCICDPGVGTSRKAIIIKVNRGDYLIGPDNGVLIPASRVLGGISSVYEITNENYMNLPVSPIFHGRDIFSPAAAHLANGVDLKSFGAKLKKNHLVESPYDEADRIAEVITAKVIHINKFGSVHLNILHKDWDNWGIKSAQTVVISLPNKKDITVIVCDTFGEVAFGENLILKDDYGRVEIAVNQGSFANRYSINIGSIIKLTLSN
ncbi:hypothetical protein CJD36_004345 [Flavipsychrobacter stenotrophus]|uniref:SAM-dependent chlorinase/fluorinase n=1 Tax=Flavipsychrobacter stenotrophus TaxID=2077091 RepID=A0A2S7T1B1_9BACT|nr:SAM-dependent chlorinase/fluorinase [Flavipsychrobacter stenotrophus]PQJ12980.1 hypothetical protein CJD36_004345 [Flavipsychrobacter stenotrophus]